MLTCSVHCTSCYTYTLFNDLTYLLLRLVDCTFFEERETHIVSSCHYFETWHARYSLHQAAASWQHFPDLRYYRICFWKNSLGRFVWLSTNLSTATTNWCNRLLFFDSNRSDVDPSIEYQLLPSYSTAFHPADECTIFSFKYYCYSAWPLASIENVNALLSINI